MSEFAQTGWTRVRTRTGQYEYQFQGRVPAVRNGQYENSSDYQFLVMDEEGWLYRIPVRLTAAAEAELQKNPAPSASATAEQARWATATRIAEAQLRAGLENYRPRQNAPYAELDSYFAVDERRAKELAAGTG